MDFRINSYRHTSNPHLIMIDTEYRGSLIRKMLCTKFRCYTVQYVKEMHPQMKKCSALVEYRVIDKHD